MYIMAYTHRRRNRKHSRRGKKHTQKGGIFKWLSSKLEDATAAVTNVVSGKKEEEKEQTSTMVPPLRGMKGGHAIHYGGFLGGLKGHFNKVKAAAAAGAGGNDGKGAAVGADENVQNASSLDPKLDDA